jgi:hypothetical protein
VPTDTTLQRPQPGPSGGPTVISPARQAELAAGAALVASAGDLLLLYVANAQRAEAGLPEAGEAPLWIGGALGVVAIPFYALGYLAASRVVSPSSLPSYMFSQPYTSAPRSQRQRRFVIRWRCSLARTRYSSYSGVSPL